MTTRNPIVLVNGRLTELPTGDSLASAAPINTGAVVQLAKIVTTGSQTTVDFTNIPQNFTDLFVVWSAQDTTVSNNSTNMRVTVNNDTTSGNYTQTVYTGYVATAGGSGTTAANANGVQCGILAQANSTSNQSSGTVTFTNYAGTSFHKRVFTVATDDDVGNSTYVLTMTARWKSTSAINRLTFRTDGTALVNGSVFTLYGYGPTNFSVSPFVDPALCNGRLSLSSGVPITTADVIGATTVYWTPYKGNRISLYSNGAWSTLSSAEVSLALGTLTSVKNYDVFAFNNSGVLALEFLAWTSDTARATALVMQDGVYVKSGAATRRYLGTFRTTSTTTTEDSGGGTTTQVGGKRFLWNYYNRVSRPLAVIDVNSSWSYTTDTWRQAGGVAGNKVEVVVGVAEEALDVQLMAGIQLQSNSARGARIAIGLDSTTAPGSVIFGHLYNASSNPFNLWATARFNTTVAVGYHYLAWLERGADGTSSLFLGLNNNAQSGMSGAIWG